MDFVGYLFLICGWVLVLAALLLLAGAGQRLSFVVAGLLVELLGLALVALHYRALSSPQKGGR